METLTVSSDIQAITDLVMQHQLVPVERSQAEGIVRLVIESAQKLCVNPVPRRVDGIIIHVLKHWGLPGRRSVCLQTADGEVWFQTGDGAIPQEKATIDLLASCIGHDVALWVKDDPSLSSPRPVIVQINDLGKAS